MRRIQGRQVAPLTEKENLIVLGRVDTFEVSGEMFTVTVLEARGYLLSIGQL